MNQKLILFSLLVFNLTILSLCVYKIITKSINKKILKELFWSIRENKKTISDEKIEETEEYLNKNKITNQVKPKIKANLKDRARITPKYVATPLPPLNLSHTGKTCPTKQIKPEKKN